MENEQLRDKYAKLKALTDTVHAKSAKTKEERNSAQAALKALEEQVAALKEELAAVKLSSGGAAAASAPPAAAAAAAAGGGATEAQVTELQEQLIDKEAQIEGLKAEVRRAQGSLWPACWTRMERSCDNHSRGTFLR